MVANGPFCLPVASCIPGLCVVQGTQGELQGGGTGLLSRSQGC